MKCDRFLRKALLPKHFSQMKRALGSEYSDVRQVAAKDKGVLYHDEQ
jgi:hypothetical protein